jgi:hypothetical protein
VPALHGVRREHLSDPQRVSEKRRAMTQPLVAVFGPAVWADPALAQHAPGGPSRV